MRERPLLIAGIGYVGEALAARFGADEREIWGLRRSPASAAGVRHLAADLGERTKLAGVLSALPERVDVCYLVAAGAYDDASYRRAYVDGLANLLAGLGADRLGRLVFVSSTSVYAQDDGAWVDEMALTQPAGFGGQRCLEGEALAREAGGVVVRFGGIYGPGRRRLVRLVSAGHAITGPERARFQNRIHRHDAAAALQHILTLEAPADCYLVVDDAPVDLREVQAWLCAQLGRSPSELSAAPSATRGGGKRCLNGRLRATGFEFRYPSYREGYQALLQKGAR